MAIAYVSATQDQPDDDAQRLDPWNETQHAYPDAAVVHELFDHQASKTPDRVALEFGDDYMTFGALQERSDKLAHLLVEKGVTTETPVGVAMFRSIDMIVGMLAILKAGGAYLPLDPGYPADRLRLMIEDADVDLILTAPDVDGFPGSRAEMVDVQGFEGTGQPTGPPTGRAAPDDTMYITFTSGSTGRPNGVRGTHRGALNRFNWQWETFPFASDEVCCQKTSLNYLDHLAETWAPLLKGHRLVLIPDAAVQDGGRFIDVLDEHRIQRLVTVPSLLHTLLRSVPDIGTKLTHLRYCTLSGERLTADLAAEFRATLPGTVLLNLYGMSEASADATWYDDRWALEGDTFPIGRPIHNTKIYILDDERKPVSVGETGEIYVGGVGLAKDYLGRPDLTAERFPSDPFEDHDDARMYRTGDLGRWRPEGILEYVGRLDHQVKIRGIRIELGEVETAIRAIDEVDEAVVVSSEIGSARQLVAYATGPGEAPATSARIRERLASWLPDHMVPARVIFLDQLPLTPSGKIDRTALPDPIGQRPASTAPFAVARTNLEREMVQLWRELLLIDDISVDDSFFDLGGDSLLVVQLRAQLEDAFGVRLSTPDLYEHRTIRALAPLIEAARGVEPVDSVDEAPSRDPAALRSTGGTDVAIIGMAGRFPGAANLGQFWDNLSRGVDGMRRLTDEEVRTFEPNHQDKLDDPDYVPVVGTLDDVQLFDAEFFGIRAGEARTLDPQHRIWFETAWEALEDGGYAPGKTNYRIGVFAGSYTNTYIMYNLLHDRAAIEDYVRMQSPGSLQQNFNNDRDYLPTRTSHLLDLRGPAINVQTACSTSLVAVTLACRAIANGDAEMALAGGVSVVLPQAQGYFYQEGGIRSVDGRTRPFDAAGTGTVFTSGVGAVLLKGLDQAVADGDTIHAVIKGAAINNDGSDKASYMAPSIDGQVDVIVDAQRRAGIDSGSVSYVEAHGTATPLGDPIEVAALDRAFKQNGTMSRKVALGSVKSNIGHTDAAAGVAGLIKTVLAMTHGAIPPTPHFEEPNPEIDFENSVFYVPDQLEPWPTGAEPRRAGVSSFGVGGTNAHVVLEEAPAVPDQAPTRPRQLLLLSARTETALATMRRALADHLEAARPLLADVAYTLTVGRSDFSRRWSVVASDLDEALASLRSDRTAPSSLEIESPDVVMMFPGQGAQFVGMGRELFEHEPVYRESIDRCAVVLEPLLDLDLRDVLYPENEEDPEAAQQLTRTGLAQPAIFAVSYALAQLWMSWGVRPKTLVGHSVGEYVAATIAGVFSLDDALTIIAARARLMQALPGGSMRAVRLSPDELSPHLVDGVGVAAVNTPTLSIVSGSDDAISRFDQDMQDAAIDTIELHTSHAFHSEMMDPILDAFRDVVAGVARSYPTIPIVSTVTGLPLTDAESVDPDYWAGQVRRPVRFSDAVMTLHQEPKRLYLEVGPGKTLSGAVLQHPNGQNDDARVAVVDSLGHPSKRSPALGTVLAGLGAVWQAGVPVDWTAFYSQQHRRRVPLPTYPFERQRHWVDPPPLGAQRELKTTPPQKMVFVDVPASSPSSPSQDAKAPPANGTVPDDPIADWLTMVIADHTGRDAAAIDRNDNFTDLGFDSLVLTQVNSQIRRKYRVRIPLVQLLTETSSVQALAARITRDLKDGPTNGHKPRQPVGEETATG